MDEFVIGAGSVASLKLEGGSAVGLAIRNGVPAALVAFQAALMAQNWYASSAPPTWSRVLIFAELVLVALMFSIRRDSVQTSWRLDHVAVALFATFGPFMLALVPATPRDPQLMAANAMGTIGLLFAIWSVLSLNRSFGVLPANRGVQTGGPYRIVRHPLYLAYQLVNFGFLINNPTWLGGAIVFLTLGAQVFRALAEEKVLENDPSYMEYEQEVRYRLVPFVF